MSFPSWNSDNYGRKIGGVVWALEWESREISTRYTDSDWLEAKAEAKAEAKEWKSQGRKARVIASGDQFSAFRTWGVFVEPEMSSNP